MKANFRLFAGWVLPVWGLTVLVGCTTVKFRDIQDDFNTAAQLDNGQAVEALGPVTAWQMYDEVHVNLTDDYIHSLDQRLQPTAYTMRAIAEWRTGKLNEARETAKRGLSLAETVNSPRDHMALEIMPALLIDEELQAKFRQARKTVRETDYYATYHQDYATAAAKLKEVIDRLPPSTPESARYYAHYQRLRVLKNWDYVAATFTGDGSRPECDYKNKSEQVFLNRDAHVCARKAVEEKLGAKLEDEIRQELGSVPASHPLYQAMRTLVGSVAENQ